MTHLVWLAILFPMVGATVCHRMKMPRLRWHIATVFSVLPVLILGGLTFSGEDFALGSTLIEAGSQAIAIGASMAVAFAILQFTAPEGGEENRSISARLLLEALALTCLFARDLRLLFVAWIVLPVPLWWAAAKYPFLYKKNRYGYLIFQSFAFLLMVVALSYLLWLRTHRGFVDTFDLPTLLSLAMKDRMGLRTLGVVVCVAALLRQGAFPFQTGLFALTEWAPLEMLTALLISQSGLVLLFRVGVPLLGTVLSSHHLALTVFSVSGLLYVSFLGIARPQARRLFAVFSIFDASLILIGIASGEKLAYLGQGIHLVASILVIGGMGSVLSLLERRIGNLNKAQGLAKIFPLASGFLFVLLLSAIHFPIALGFIGEELLVDALFQRSTALAVVGLISSLLLSIAAFRFYFSCFFHQGWKSVPVPDLLKRERIALASLLVLLVGLAVCPGPLIRRMGVEDEPLDRAFVNPGAHNDH